MSRIKQEKTNLVDAILEEGKVGIRFRPTMKKTLLKLSHNDIGNLALGFVIYKKEIK